MFYIVLRVADVKDADRLIKLMSDVERSNKMLYDPDEHNTTIEEMEQRIRTIRKFEQSVLIIAEDQKSMLGYLFVIGSTINRTKHRASIIIGVASLARGKGVGKALMEYAENWARERGMYRLELTTLLHNYNAIALYERQGFKREGMKHASLYIDGEYEDEIYFYKILS